MKSLNGVILGVLLVVIIIWGVVAYNKKNNNEAGLYVGITDATADINNVSEVEMAVKKVEVYSATEGWVMVSSDSKNYKLLALNANGETRLYAKNSDLEAGTYDRIRITLGDTTIHTKTDGNVKATIPSQQIVMNTKIVVAEKQKTHITLDFLADKSLHMTADGKYIFAPVVKAESRSNTTIALAKDDKVTVTGGNVDSNATIGMDLNGTSRGNFELKSGADLKIESENNGMLKFMLGGKSYSSNAAENRENQDGASNSMDGSLNGSVNGAINGSSSTTINGSLNGGVQNSSSSSSINANGGLDINLGR